MTEPLPPPTTNHHHPPPPPNSNCSVLCLFDLLLRIVEQVELVDMHFGTGSDTLQDPYRFADQLAEIRHCHQVSRGCFFMVSFLLGSSTLNSSSFSQLFSPSLIVIFNASKYYRLIIFTSHRSYMDL